MPLEIPEQVAAENAARRSELSAGGSPVNAHHYHCENTRTNRRDPHHVVEAAVERAQPGSVEFL